MSGIQRFIKAQQGNDSFPSFQHAFKEIDNGRKQSHWIWYIFPQLASLGYSSKAKYFGIVDFDEACECLQDDELFKNYRALTQLVLERLQKTSVERLMGGTDHFNSKSRDTKVHAAEQLQRMITSKDTSLSFTPSEKTALADGRLKTLLAPYGGVEGIIHKITDEQE